MNYPQILILSSLYDFSVDLVVSKILKSGIPYIRLNKEDLPKYRITLDPINQQMQIRYGSETFLITNDHLKSVWFRQPIFLRNTPSKGLSLNEQLMKSQWSAFLRALSLFSSAKWMNWPQSTYLAESKPYQLSLASRLGFTVPKTRVSNDIYGIRESKFKKNVILKSLDTVLLNENKECFFTYSTITDHNFWKEEELSDSPALVQECIENKTDIRVTIIGDKLYATKILKNGQGIQGDWRVTPKASLEYEPIELSKSVSESCLNITRELGLNFAGIDLLENSKQIVFLEINPTGEWQWIASNDYPFDKIIAEWLCDF
jgi:glutathione synthase/RimK-type ligase-like ATP-grasp enzyme